MNTATNIIDDLRLLEPALVWWWWIAAGAVVALLAGFWLVRRKRRLKTPGQLHAEACSAWQTALDALARLLALLKPEESRRYGIESTAIIRAYIEARFSIRAPMQATEEFLIAASRSDLLAPRHRELLADYLSRCDLLKFARHFGAEAELRALHDAAVRFVQESKPGPPRKETPP